MNEVYELLLYNSLHSMFFNRIYRQDFTIGSPASVEFDWEHALSREEEFGDVMGFFHTHPFTGEHSSEHCIGFSSIDFDTMSAWVDCFGKPLYCLIGNKIDDANPSIHVFASPKSIVGCMGMILGVEDEDTESNYYKGTLELNLDFSKREYFLLPHLSII